MPTLQQRPSPHCPGCGKGYPNVCAGCGKGSDPMFVIGGELVCAGCRVAELERRLIAAGLVVE